MLSGAGFGLINKQQILDVRSGSIYAGCKYVGGMYGSSPPVELHSSFGVLVSSDT